MAKPERSDRPGSTPGLEGNQIAMNQMLDFNRFEPFDSNSSHEQAVQLDSELAEACKNGDLVTVKAIVQKIRDSTDPVINRPSAWQWRNVSRKFFEKLYENNHWHVIEYLARQPEIEIMPPTSNMGNWNLSQAITQHAVAKNDITELEKLLELGWDINQYHGHKGSYWPSITPPVLSEALRNENIVKWFLAHGADVNAPCDIGMTPMVIAAREASLSTLRLLVEHGGEVAGTDLVAQAALGDSWGEPDRISVIKYLLDQGADINAIAGSTWKAQKHFSEQRKHFGGEYYMRAYGGGQSALYIAQLCGNQKLVELLLANGADQSLKQLREEPIENLRNRPI